MDVRSAGGSVGTKACIVTVITMSAGGDDVHKLKERLSLTSTMCARRNWGLGN